MAADRGALTVKGCFFIGGRPLKILCVKKRIRKEKLNISKWTAKGDFPLRGRRKGLQSAGLQFSLRRGDIFVL